MSIATVVASAVFALATGVGASVVGATSAPSGPNAPSAPSTSPVGAGQPLTATSTPAQGRWLWPIQPDTAVARLFDPPDQPWLPGHRGVDLVAGIGVPVVAPNGGRIAFAGVLAGRGVVVVAHGGGLRSTFEPVDAGPAVGTVVAPGERIGRVAATPGHCGPGTCLHWGVLRGDTYLDPLDFLGDGPIYLLPLPR